ncbi:RlpA-like double-psi beta-barrel-protein domain-containing protein-containing protein [Lenzites betulinus]|nr:RlpA-like double-psi beta-barrel-protein domain-containing protein-containing protein [Lenzites betulinus]
MFSTLVRLSVVTSLLSVGVSAFTGDGTFFNPGGAFGACGSVEQDSDFVVALSADQYAGGANCFRRVSISFQGHQVSATVEDLCPGCASGSIDMSPVVFQELAALSVGRLHGVEWNFE